MSGLFATLGNSVKALTANSRAIEIAGKNMANVNNPNYARQRVIYGDRGTVQTSQGPESMGIEAVGVEQIRDPLLDKQLLREIALKSSYEAEQSGYQRAQAGLGESIDRTSSASDSTANQNGLSAAIDDFFNAFGSFAASPTDSGERQALLQKAAILTDRFQLADQRIASVQTDLDSEINTDVSDVNQLLQTIADLNKQIGRFEINAPGSAIDLRDQRQARLEELAAKMPIDVTASTNGMVQVTAKDGGGGNVVLVNNAAVQNTVAFTGTAFTAGTPATTLALTGGSMQGALTARDGTVQTLRNDLDSLVNQLVTSVNGAYNPLGTTGDFFTAANLTAGTISLDSSLNTTSLKSSDSGAAGDNDLALAVAQLANTKYATASSDSIDGTFSEFFSKTVSKLGQSLAGANARVDDQSKIEQLVRSQRDGVSGVSIDEEMADLLKYQRAFQASSRVFSVVDELLDTVVNRLGV